MAGGKQKGHHKVKTILVYGDTAIPELEHLSASEPELAPVINGLIETLRGVPRRP